MWRILAIVLCNTTYAVAVSAQYAPTPDSPLSPPDSLRVLDAAQHAQAAFERFRQSHLHHAQPAASDLCDVRIGRFCYWHHESDSLVSDTRAVRAARERLIQQLTMLGAKNPHDQWIVAQEVNYLVEAGDDSRAILTAYDCRATLWWCQALRGFAFHAAARYADAEAAYDSALANMPVVERCTWTNIALLLSDTERDAYNKIPCKQRTEFEHRFWLLADPSYIVPGNDRRTEHFSRVLLTKLLASSRNTYGVPWNDDMRELVIRYGMARSYSVTWPDNVMDNERLIGHEREPSYHFVANNVESDSTTWDFHAPDARERYAPPYMDSLISLQAQFAMFKRGDSALIVVVYKDSTPGRSAVGIMGNDTAFVKRDSVPERKGAILNASAPKDFTRATSMGYTTAIRYAYTRWHGLVAGLEQYNAEARRDAQVRQWLAPPHAGIGAPQLSTLLFYRGTTTAAMVSDSNTAADMTNADTTNTIIAKRALPNHELHGTRKLGVYWEMYGPYTGRRIPPIQEPSPVQGEDTSHYTSPDTAQDAPLDVSISITRIDGGGFGRWLAHALHLVPTNTPLAVTWHGQSQKNVRRENQTATITTQSVVLDLGWLSSGTYRVTVSAGTDVRHRSETWSDIRVY